MSDEKMTTQELIEKLREHFEQFFAKEERRGWTICHDGKEHHLHPNKDVFYIDGVKYVAADRLEEMEKLLGKKAKE